MGKYLPWIAIGLLLIIRFWATRPVYHDGDRLRIQTQVLSEPTYYSSSQTLKLKGLKVTLPDYPEVHYGDRVVVEGVVKVGALESAKLIQLTRSTNFLLNLRRKVIVFYQQTLPEPHAALLSGIVLGSKENLGQNFWNDLRKTGTAHIVVASGMNTSLTAGFLMSFLISFVKRSRAALLSLTGVWIYAFISGFEAPIVRASIMTSISLLALLSGRLYDATRALLLSAAVMLFINPDWLWDLGFLLSFVATACLMLFESRVNRMIHFVPSIFREGLATSLAAQIGVAPIIWLTFGQFNLFSPLINAVVLWTIAPIMVIGLVAALVSLLLPVVASVILYLAYPLTYFFVWVITSTSSRL